MAPINLGPVRVHFVYYETPVELRALLSRATLDANVDAREPIRTIVLAIPDTMRAVLGWATKGAPRPEIHGDVLVFQRPKP